MRDLPTGILTFLFTDIVGSTRLWEEHPQAMSQAYARHGAIIADAVQTHSGVLVRSRGEGDSTFSVFTRPEDAVAAACALQIALHQEPWPPDATIRVRAALHTGEGETDGYDYNSADVNRCARIRAIAHGGQTLLSRATAERVHDALPKGASLRDLGLHRLKDLSRPERVFQLLHPDLPADFPPLLSLNALPNNLPQHLTSFIGRQREIKEIGAQLASARILTLAGPGGLGKTRLALQAAAQLLDEFPGGVWFVDLAPLRDEGLVPRAVAGAVGARDEPARDTLDVLIAHLRDRRALIVLDNCEHLIGACAKLAEELLEQCSLLRILATSREPLRIPGETVWRLMPLTFPSLEGPVLTPDPIVLGRYDAVRLFVDRARSANAQFRLTAANAPAVTEICRRLDGIPLALELAASRTASLGIENVSRRLDDLFRLLTGGSRTSLPRQQTLEALIGWSYDLLDDAERVVFRRLAVFAGSWDLEAAEVIIPDGRSRGDPAQDVLTILAQLVDKSLVMLEEDGSGAERYRMLQTIRAYAQRRLDEAGEADAVAARHLAYYTAMVEKAEPQLVGPHQAQWLDRLEADHDNIRAALAFALAAGHTDEGLRLASAVWRFWLVRGYLNEGRSRLASLLDAARPQAPSQAFCKALHAEGRLAGCQGDYEAASALLLEALHLQEALGDKRGAAASLLSLGVVAGERGDMDQAEEYFRRSLKIQQDEGDVRGSAMSLQNLGNVAVYRQDWHTARSFLEQSLRLCRQVGDTQGMAIALNNLGHICARLEDFDTAHRYFRESLALCRNLGYKVGIASGTDEIAKLAAARNDAERACRLMAASISLREEIHAPVPQTDREEFDRLLSSIRCRLGPERFAAVWNEGRAMSLDEAVAYALEDLDVPAGSPQLKRTADA
ncbi:MAG: ATP-binding protein [Chthonomonadales bacterium]